SLARIAQAASGATTPNSLGPATLGHPHALSRTRKRASDAHRERRTAQLGELLRPVKRPEDGAVNEVAGDYRKRRLPAVVQAEKARRLDLLGRGRSLLLARHPRVETGKQRHDGGEDEEGVNETNS